MQYALSFVGKHWKEIAITILLFVVSFFWWQDHRGLVRAYDASVESYEIRINALKESYQRETERKSAVLKEYEEKVFLLESQYSKAVEEIEIAKSEREEEIVILRRENPEQLIQEIEESFGFEYIP